MELVEGETLADRLKRGKLSIEQTLQYGSQIADALAAAHAKDIIHRDLKPGNIMLTKKSGVKVLDFGLAKSSQDETLTGIQVMLGTPAYMAPEQRNAKGCDARTDIYALGLVLWPGRIVDAMELYRVARTATDIGWDSDGAKPEVRRTAASLPGCFRSSRSSTRVAFGFLESRCEEKAIHCPSGDHDGRKSPRG
jgi:serine/threonine protein kinase